MTQLSKAPADSRNEAMPRPKPEATGFNAFHDQLHLFRINKRSPLPVYVQIVNRVISAIDDHSIPPGMMLPSEKRISEYLGISKMTLRHAYSVLETQGYIGASRGKGTFVQGSRIEKNLPEMLSFSEEVRARGGKPSSKILSVKVVPASQTAQEFLRLTKEELVYEIKRLRFADELPLAIEIVQLPKKLFPDIDRFRWEAESLYSVMENSYGVRLSRCYSEIEATAATREQAMLLNLSVGGPLIVISRRSYSDEDFPVEFSITSYPGNCYTVTSIAIRHK